MRLRGTCCAFATFAVALTAAAAGASELRCFKAADATSFDGVVDISTSLLGLEDNCKVKLRSKMFCVPATLTVVSSGGATDYVGDDSDEAQICYKARCLGTGVADQVLTDRFGTRTFTKVKESIFCTPARLGAAPACGDNDVNLATEDCDGTDDSACPGKCRVDCTCGVCGDGTLDPGEACDTTTGYVNVSCTPECTYDFSGVAQLYCNGTCSVGGPAGCDQSDADVFCKLKTGSPTSTASAYTLALAANDSGFGCLGTNLGPQPQYGVFSDVLYVDTNLSGTHGSGATINSVTCLP